MDEQKKVELVAAEDKRSPEEKMGELIKEAELTEIEKAEAKIRQLDELNKQLQDRLKTADKLQADIMLRGRSIANAPQKSEEDLKNEAAMKLIEGTGLKIKL